ncbi:MAG: hypothetical protein WCY84_02405 [Candidatus Cloacimonadaceae bacterium]
MLSNKSIFLTILSLACSLLLGFSITDDYFGNAYGALDARSYAMGSAGIYNDFRAAGITENPANLSLMKRFAALHLGGNLNRTEDIRMLPLYNSFDNYIDDAVYASNINNYTAFSAAGFIAPSFGAFNLGIGAYHRPLYSFEGTYREEIRNNRNTDDDMYPEKIAQNDIENKGVVSKSAAVLAVGYSFKENLELHLGADYGWLQGDIEKLKTVQWSDWAIERMPANRNLPEYSHQVEYELKGGDLKLGAALRLGARWGLGFSYSPPKSLKLKGTDYEYREAFRNTAVDSTFTDLDDTHKYPSQMKLGFAYYPRNTTRTVFNMDFECVDYEGVNKAFDPLYNIYAGVEHHIVYRMPLRLGFQAVNSYLVDRVEETNAAGETFTAFVATKVLTPMITGGSSIELAKNLILDLGFGYAWREYSALDLFGDSYYNDKTYTGSSTYVLWPNSYIKLADRGWENPDKVKESYINLNAGISICW